VSDGGGGVAIVTVGGGGAAPTEAEGACGRGEAGAAPAAWRVSELCRTGSGLDETFSVGATSARTAEPALPGGFAGCSAGFAGVPGRLKFCSSRGPTVSGGGAFVVAGCVASCARAKAGASRSPAATKTVLKRKTALIAPAFVA
jgi:hypothetical protein